MAALASPQDAPASGDPGNANLPIGVPEISTPNSLECP